METLSKTDRKILSLLQKDGRMSVAEIGRRVGLTASPCADRVKRLESQGVITGYYARLSPTKLDAGLVVFVQVTLQRTAGDAFKTFTDAIELIPEVEECHLKNMIRWQKDRSKEQQIGLNVTRRENKKS